MKKRTLSFALLGAVLLVVMAGCGGGNKSVKQLDGAGATFPLPYYQLAFKRYDQDSAIRINYGAIGSGGGVRSLIDRVVDFAATDAFLTEEEMASFEGGVIHIPTCLGAVAVAYNLEGVNELRLTPEVLAGIYLGEITSWRDTAIARLNPAVQFPDLPITPVYRSDGSGTTFVFSHYMRAVSEDWANSLGEGKALNWQYGVAGKGNPGVAALIGSTPGALGYVGAEYVNAQGLTCAHLRNGAGEFVLPTQTAIAAAATGEIPADLRTMITNSPVAEAYPISCLTWIVIPKEQQYANRTPEQAVEVVRLLRWMLSKDCQELSESVDYVSLPNVMVEQANSLLNGVTYGGQPLP